MGPYIIWYVARIKVPEMAIDLENTQYYGLSLVLDEYHYVKIYA